MVRKFNVKVNNKNYMVEVEEISSSAQNIPTPQPVQQNVVSQPAPAPITKTPKKTTPPRPATTVSEGETIIESPMAGLIVDILTSAGAHVKRGDTLLILEAMKMENNILSTKDGIVKAINVSKGDEVEVGAPLIIIE